MSIGVRLTELFRHYVPLSLNNFDAALDIHEWDCRALPLIFVIELFIVYFFLPLFVIQYIPELIEVYPFFRPNNFE